MRTLLCMMIVFNGVICRESDLDVRLQKLKSLVKEKRNDTEELQDRLTRLERHVSDLILQKVNTGIGPGKSQMNAKFDVINNQANVAGYKIKRTSDEDVAFHAYLSSSRQYSNHEIFVFDTVPLNTRGGYTPSDGIFDVPISGTYVFSWTVAVPYSGVKIVTELIVHGTVKGVLTSDPDKGQSVGSGVHPATLFVVTQANAGDNVFIRVRHVFDAFGTVLSNDSNVFTSFSAWLLF